MTAPPILQVARNLADAYSRWAKSRSEDDKREIAQLQTELLKERRKEREALPPEEDA
jgi:hypothetical protein